MLTIGPILNFSSYFMFRSLENPSWWYNRAWMSSETLELVGILILDVSLIDMEEILILIAEVVGFLLLCCAAGLHFEYDVVALLPDISLRLDVAHSSECIGLGMLIVVACCQYRIKVAMHESHLHHSAGHQTNLESV